MATSKPTGAKLGPTVFLMLWALLQLPAPLLGQTEDQATADTEEQPDYYADVPLLREYVVEALERNPSIQEVWARYRAFLKKVPQVTALPELTFGFTQAIRSVETRVGPQRNAFILSQTFPWFGKLDLRGKVATQEAASWYQIFRARQREVISQLKRAFYELAYTDTAIRINGEERSLLEHYEGLAQTRYATGQGLQQAVIKIQAEITRTMDRAATLQRQRVTLSASLNTLMDRAPHDPIPPVGRLNLPRIQLNLEQLYALGEQNRQELKAAQALIERSEQSIDLAKKDNWPKFMVSAAFINVGDRRDPAGIAQPPPDNGKNAFSLSVGITIPIWRDKYDSAVDEAAETLVAQRSSYANIMNEMELSIRDQVVRIETLQEQVDLYENALIPQAEETLRSTEAGYETGQLGVLDLLDSERVLLNARLVNSRYYSDYLVALANLERAVGTKFPE